MISSNNNYAGRSHGYLDGSGLQPPSLSGAQSFPELKKKSKRGTTSMSIMDQSTPDVLSLQATYKRSVRDKKCKQTTVFSDNGDNLAVKAIRALLVLISQEPPAWYQYLYSVTRPT